MAVCGSSWLTLEQRSASYLLPDWTDTRQTGPQLLAANSSSIRIYGMHTFPLHFTSNTYWWNFAIVDVSHPLLGANFRCSNFLLVDLQGKWLMNAATFHSVPLSSTRGSVPRLDAICSSTDHSNLLLVEFSDITTPNFIQSHPKHGIEHLITTKEPPVHARIH